MMALRKERPLMLSRTRTASAILLLVAIATAQTAAPKPLPKTIYVVRHAEKRTDDPKDPDLNSIGMTRARCLAETLKRAEIDQVIVTEFKRTQQTATFVTPTPSVIKAGDTQGLMQELTSGKRATLIVGHSNTVPGIVKEISGQEVPAIPDSEYDNLFVIDGQSRDVKHLRYCPNTQ
jgi:phosphohistidine phosphatase SixA